jgi:bifunctional DNA-binding transcriptional regulator/antitoxin component of YhaV-PrlF toxin-antitoxin module
MQMLKMAVIQTKNQRRVGIPFEFAELLDIKKGDNFEFYFNEKTKILTAKLIKGRNGI